MTKLTKTDILFIRACKFEHLPYERVVRVYNRFYLGGHLEEAEVDHTLHGILRRVVDKFNPDEQISILNCMVNDMNPYSDWMKSEEEKKWSYNKCAIESIISTIRWMDIDKFPTGMVWGIRWRR